MSAGLVRQALRRHPWWFLGLAATLTLGAVIVTAALDARASVPADTDAAELGTVFVRPPGSPVHRVEQPPLLGSLVHRDLFGLDPDAARRELLAAVGGAGPPSREPAFPSWAGR